MLVLSTDFGSSWLDPQERVTDKSFEAVVVEDIVPESLTNQER
jgi:hypothetical protein